MKSRIVFGLGALALSIALAVPAFAATKHHHRHHAHVVRVPAAPAAPGCTIHYQTGCYY